MGTSPALLAEMMSYPLLTLAILLLSMGEMDMTAPSSSLSNTLPWLSIVHC